MRILFSIFITVAVCCRVFTNMQAKLQASRDLLIAIEMVRQAMDATDFRRTLAASKGNKKGKKGKSNKSSCEKKLQQCKAAAKNSTYLLIQTRKECTIEYRKSQNKYHLISDVGDETFVFTDRPIRMEGTVPTDKFINDFDDLFENGKNFNDFEDLFESSNPNVAVTLISKETDEFLRPLVMIASNPKMTDDGKIDYKIEQSKSQYKHVY